MRKSLLAAYFLMLVLSCHVKRVDPISQQNPPDAVLPSVNEPAPDQPRQREILESYSNHTRIGRRHKNKIEIDIVKNGESRAYHPTNAAVIRFYSLTPKWKWELKQTLEVKDQSLFEANPQYADFNNDGLKDVTFVSNTAARGANEVRTLLIYDRSADKLIHIKNSESYPNLRYNKVLDCIDSWMFHGATTTVFVRLQGDQLREFASVNTGSELVVDLINKDGQTRTILRRKMKDDDVYTRFENFRPLSPRL
jgi:hypothetical protein